MGKWISLTPFVSLPGGNPDDRPAPPTTHTYTQTRPTFCHNSVVMWWECVCTGRASSLVSQLFAVGVLWLHVRPRLNPFRLCPQSGLCCRTHTSTPRCAHYSEQTIASFKPTKTYSENYLRSWIWLQGGIAMIVKRDSWPENKKYPTLERGNKSISYNSMVWYYI